jgi:hypothetical protein
MTDQIEVISSPSLQKGTADLDAARRIRELNRDINGNPELFMESCQRLGGMAVEYMTEEITAPELTKKTQKLPDEIDKRLKTFLDNNDLRKAEFDLESDNAIYDNIAVVGLTKTMKSARSQRVKQGRDYVARENAHAVESRDSLSVLKLYLYANRVRLWKQKVAESASTITGNGAA